MDVLLVNANLDADMRGYATALPNIGLAYLISAIKKQYNVRLIDSTFYAKDYKEYISKKIKDFNPDVVGFSAITFNFQNSLKMARFIKQVIPEPDVPFIWGGVHPTLCAEETISEQLVDAVCIGEGEISFIEYLNKINAGEQPYNVEGIWFKDSQNNIVKNKLRPFIQNLDSLSFPDWDDFEIDRYLKFSRRGMTFLTSRGCPFKCTFCSSPAIGRLIPGRYYRTRSPESVIEEIKIFKKKHPAIQFKHIYFGDETFGLDSKQFQGICGLLQREHILQDITWSCETRADLVTDEWAKTASASRCTMVKLGIESADESIRNKVYKKDISDDAIKDAIANLRMYDIKYFFLMLIGSYKESKESINKNLQLINTFIPVSFHCFIYCPTPGTELYETTKMVLSDYNIKKEWNSNQRPEPVLLFSLKLIIIKLYIYKAKLFFLHGFRQRGIKFIFDAIFIFMHWRLTQDAGIGPQLDRLFNIRHQLAEKYILTKNQN
jgi:anaerobic magnesium-protoporphyrin IX monomethyl ester cyclase